MREEEGDEADGESDGKVGGAHRVPATVSTRASEQRTHQKRVLLELMFEAANLMNRGNESSSMSFQMAS